MRVALIRSRTILSSPRALRVTAWRPLAIPLSPVILNLPDAVAAHCQRLQSGNVSAAETSSLHLDALRDLKRVTSHLIEGAAYPVLSAKGALLPTRLRSAAQRP